ncbi:GNAT family N-acetyltransferase [Eubacteriaceae bacterium ES3]|nr:GNAT family N-acetyltransferase [Eubacteriaceae bacterium ES3]
MIRNGTLNDLNRIMEIYESARDLMKTSGNPNQWTNGYPEEWRVREDIDKKTNYVCESNGSVEAVFVFLREGDPDYLRINHGEWLNSEPYAAIHRVASAETGKGMTKEIFEWCFSQCPNLKIDTHRDNKIMQHVLVKNGFKQCGIVYLREAGERVAFQKVK